LNDVTKKEKDKSHNKKTRTHFIFHSYNLRLRLGT